MVLEKGGRSRIATRFALRGRDPLGWSWTRGGGAGRKKRNLRSSIAGENRLGGRHRSTCHHRARWMNDADVDEFCL